MSKETLQSSTSNIEIHSEDIRKDNVFKSLFKYKGIIAMLLKYTIPELKDKSIADIISYIHTYSRNNKEISVNTKSLEEQLQEEVGLSGIENGDAEEKLIKYDILFSLKIPDSSGAIVKIDTDLEMQKAKENYDMIQRAIYYNASLLRDTLEKSGNYNDINKVYSIWICAHNEFLINTQPDKSDKTLNTWFHRFLMLEAANSDESINHRSEFIYNPRADLMHTIVIELPRMEEMHEKYPDFMSELYDILNGLFSNKKDKIVDTIEKHTSVNITKLNKIGKGVDTMLTLEQQQAIYYRDGIEKGKADLVKRSFNNLFQRYKDKNKTLNMMNIILELPVDEILEILDN